MLSRASKTHHTVLLLLLGAPDKLLEVLCAVSTGVDACQAVNQLPSIPLLLTGGVLRELRC
jgi:hypothetical protein